MTEIRNFQDLGKHVEFETEFLEPKRGEIYYVDLNDVAVGTVHIMSKTRPAMIIQNDKGNIHSGTVIVALLTTQKPNNKLYPMQYRVELNEIPSVIMFEQLMTVDKNRLTKKVGELTPKQLKEAESRLMYSLELNRFSIDNVMDIDVTSRINVKTKTEDYIGFTIEILFKEYKKLETKIKLEKLQEFDNTIHSDINFEELKSKLDCCKGLNWLVNNNEL